MTCPNIESKNAKTALDDANKALTERTAAAAKALKLPATAPPTEVASACNAVIAEVEAADTPITGDVRTQALACGDYKAAVTVASNRQASYDWSLEWINRRQNVSDGQLLFETYCARCHTEGWSVFDPSAPPGKVNSVDILGLSGGGGGTGGGIGFNLRNGATVRRFGTDANGGWALQQQFITDGSDPNKGYGIGGIGSGKMPGFGQMLHAGADRCDRLVRAVLPQRDELQRRDPAVPDADDRAEVPGATTTTAPATTTTTAEADVHLLHMLVLAAESGRTGSGTRRSSVCSP